MGEVKKLSMVNVSPDRRWAMDDFDKEMALKAIDDLRENIENDNISALVVVAPMSNRQDVLMSRVGVHNCLYTILGGLHGMANETAFAYHTGPMIFPEEFSDDMDD